MEDIINILKLYKENKITQYACEQSLSSNLGSMCEVRFHDDTDSTTTTSFAIFAVPEFHVNGVKIVFFVDKGLFFNNFYTEEELFERLEKIAQMKPAIVKEIFKFVKDHEQNVLTFGDALACFLRIYQGTLGILKVENRDFLPDENKIAKFVNDFEDGKNIDTNLEELYITNSLPKEVVEIAKEMAHDSPDIYDAKIIASNREEPSFNLGQQEIRNLCTGTFGTREHKEIPFDFKPSTNQ